MVRELKQSSFVPFGECNSHSICLFLLCSTRIKDNYKIGTSGSISKSSVYQHFLQAWQHKIFLSATSFGKLMRKAFPDITYNKKGPRGRSMHHYTHLKRIDHDKRLSEIITMTSFPPPLYPTSPFPSTPSVCGNSVFPSCAGYRNYSDNLKVYHSSSY